LTIICVLATENDLTDLSPENQGVVGVLILEELQIRLLRKHFLFRGLVLFDVVASRFTVF